MEYVRCQGCNWVFRAARIVCPLCGRCTVCGDTLQSRRKSKRRASAPRCDSPGYHDEDALRRAAKAFGVPDEDVEAEQRRYAPRKRLKGRAAVWSTIIGGQVTAVGPLVAIIFPGGVPEGATISVLGLLTTLVLHWLIVKAGRSSVELPAVAIRLQNGRDERLYARLLDHFEIELAVSRPEEGQLTYVSKFVEKKPKTRTAYLHQEQRLVLGVTGSDLPAVDKALLRRAGITVGHDQLVLFCFPRKVEQELCRLEQEACFGDVARVRKTVFGTRATGDDFAFYVVEQEYIQPARMLEGQRMGA